MLFKIEPLDILSNCIWPYSEFKKEKDILPSKEIQNSIGNKTKEAVYMSSSVRKNIKDVDRIISELY